MCNRLPSSVKSKSFFWRLILGHYASMTELRDVWTLEDVMDITDLLDAKDYMEELAREQLRKR